MDQKQLDYFLMLCKERNITKAAEKLFLTRQALSSCINSLEKELDTTLLTRSKTGVSLTEAGQYLKEYAEQEAFIRSALEKKIQHTSGPNSIRFGSHLMHLDNSAIQTIMQFQELYPSAKISFFNEENHKIFWKMLKEDELDVAQTRKAPEDGDLEWVKVKDLPISALMCKSNPLTKKSVLDFDTDLSGQIYLTVSKDTLEEMRPHLLRAGMVGEYVAPNTKLLQEMIAKGNSIFAAPKSSIPALYEDRTESRDIMNFPIPVGTYLVFRPNPPQRIRHFVDYLCSAEGWGT